MHNSKKTALALFFFTLFCATAEAEFDARICIKHYMRSTSATALGFRPSDVENLISKEANAIGLSPQGIKIIPCDQMPTQVESNYLVQDGEIAQGDYILYDPVWVRQVVGLGVSGANQSVSRDQAVFLFGHELGHLLQRHFTANIGLTRLEKETQADRFAGCAAGALDADWANISNFIGKIREDTDGYYPSRIHSLEIVKKQFDACRGKHTPSPSRYVANGLGPNYTLPKMNGRTLDGCMISTTNPNGDDCSTHGTLTVASIFCKVAGYSAAENVRTTFFNVTQQSYKLTEKLTADGSKDYIWNEDNGGGYEIASLTCKNLN